MSRDKTKSQSTSHQSEKVNITAKPGLKVGLGVTLATATFSPLSFTNDPIIVDDLGFIGGPGTSLHDAIVIANQQAGPDIIRFSPAIVAGSLPVTLNWDEGYNPGSFKITDDLIVYGENVSVSIGEGSYSTNVFSVYDASLQVDDLNIYAQASTNSYSSMIEMQLTSVSGAAERKLTLNNVSMQSNGAAGSLAESVSAIDVYRTNATDMPAIVSLNNVAISNVYSKLDKGVVNINYRGGSNPSFSNDLDTFEMVNSTISQNLSGQVAVVKVDTAGQVKIDRSDIVNNGDDQNQINGAALAVNVRTGLDITGTASKPSKISGNYIGDGNIGVWLRPFDPAKASGNVALSHVQLMNNSGGTSLALEPRDAAIAVRDVQIENNIALDSPTVHIQPRHNSSSLMTTIERTSVHNNTVSNGTYYQAAGLNVDLRNVSTSASNSPASHQLVIAHSSVTLNQNPQSNMSGPGGLLVLADSHVDNYKNTIGVDIVNSTISGNLTQGANLGGAGVAIVAGNSFGDGGYYAYIGSGDTVNQGTDLNARIINSTISHNASPNAFGQRGSGLFVKGLYGEDYSVESVYYADQTVNLNLVNSTISNNTTGSAQTADDLLVGQDALLVGLANTHLGSFDEGPSYYDFGYTAPMSGEQRTTANFPADFKLITGQANLSALQLSPLSKTHFRIPLDDTSVLVDAASQLALDAQGLPDTQTSVDQTLDVRVRNTLDIGAVEFIPPNTKPSITNTLTDLSVNEDGNVSFFVEVSDPEDAFADIDVDVTPVDQSLVPLANVQVADVLDDTVWKKQVSIQPANNLSGQTDITLRANDGSLTSDPQTITLTVLEQPDAPTILNDDEDTTVDEDFDTSEVQIAIHVKDPDYAISEQGLTLSSSIESETVAGLFVIDSIENNGLMMNEGDPEHTIRFLLNISLGENLSGVSTIKLTAQDNSGLEDEFFFTVTVNAVNDQPTFNTPLTAEGVTFFEGETQSISFDGVDIEDPASALELVVVSSNPGVIAASDVSVSSDYKTLFVSSQPEQSGRADITVSIKDSQGYESVSDTFAVNVQYNPDGTFFTSSDQYVVDEDSDPGVLTIEIEDKDLLDANYNESFTWSFEVAPEDSGMIAFASSALSDSVVGDKVTKDVTIIPQLNQFGSLVLTAKAEDAQGYVHEQNITVTLNPVNDEPIIATLANMTISNASVENHQVVNVLDVDLTDADRIGQIDLNVSTDKPELFESLSVDNGFSFNQTVLSVVRLTPVEGVDTSETATITVEADDGIDQTSQSFTVSFGAQRPEEQEPDTEFEEQALENEAEDDVETLGSTNLAWFMLLLPVAFRKRWLK